MTLGVLLEFLLGVRDSARVIFNPKTKAWASVRLMAIVKNRDKVEISVRDRFRIRIRIKVRVRV